MLHTEVVSDNKQTITCTKHSISISSKTKLFAVIFNSDDVYAIISANIELTDSFSNPSIWNGNFKNSVFFVEFDVDYWFHDIRDDYVVYYWEPLVLLEHLEEALANNNEMSAEVRERVMKLKNSLDENDNNVMMICKFKKQ